MYDGEGTIRSKIMSIGLKNGLKLHFCKQVDQGRLELTYILAYKSRNFGPNLAKILSIQLIRGSNIFGLKLGFITHLCA